MKHVVSGKKPFYFQEQCSVELVPWFSLLVIAVKCLESKNLTVASPVFPEYAKLAILAFSYCLTLKINWNQLSVPSF